MSAVKASRLMLWLRVPPDNKPRIYRHVYAGAELSNVSYWLEIMFSAGIATLGLILNSPAVIIGAMLISPLMEPIMATGMATAAGDVYLAGKALLKLTSSILLAMALSAGLVWLLPFHSATGEILSRTTPTLLDLMIALLSGLAGSVAVSRSAGSADGMTTLPGVAIAVALMPPLCTVGFGIGSGFRSEIMRGAGLLFVTNIVAIVFSAFLVFLLVGMDSADVREEIHRSHQQEPMAILMERSRSRNLLSGGQLRWRVLILLAMLVAVAWPLQQALRQLTGEARTREAVHVAIEKLLPKNELVSEQTEVGRENVVVHVVTTGVVSPAKVKEEQEDIRTHSGRAASLTVESVASQSELAKLVERMESKSAVLAVPPSPPTPPSVDEEAAHLADRVVPVVKSAWPPDIPLQSVGLSFQQGHLVVEATYTATKALDPVALEVITQSLQGKLETPTLTVQAQRVSPPSRREAARRRRSSPSSRNR